MLSIERLKELLEYEPDTGWFKWKVTLGSRAVAGQYAGTIDPSGYFKIQIGGYRYGAHQLAWAFAHDEWCMVDHQDNMRSNNKLTNLRKATHQQNAANREYIAGNTGTKGVHRRNNRYEAGIKVNQKRIYLGCFKTLEEAKDAYDQAAKRYFGEFARS